MKKSIELKSIVRFLYFCNNKRIETMTLILDSTSAKKLLLLKELALQLGVKVIETNVSLEKMPNAETKKAMKDVEIGKVYKAENMTDLMKHLNS